MDYKYATGIFSYVRSCKLSYTKIKSTNIFYYNKDFFISVATAELPEQLMAFSGTQVTCYLPSSVHWEEKTLVRHKNPPHTQRTLIHLEHHPLICLHHFI